jgi:speckle-type POZ protein
MAARTAAAPHAGGALSLAPHCTSANTSLYPHPAHEHVWRLTGVTPDFFTSAQPGYKLVSPPFVVRGVSWCVWLCPNGCTKAQEGHVSLYLKLLSQNTTAAPAVSLTVGPHRHSFSSHKVFCSRSPRTEDAGHAWGPGQFLAHTELLPRFEEYAPGGVMAIRVTLRELGSVHNDACDSDAASPSAAAAAVRVTPHGLVPGLAALLASGEGTDVTLLCGDERLGAHALLLCVQSPVFAAQLREGPLQADASAVPVPPDITPHTLRRLLEFLYTDELEPASPEEATHLLNAADHYGLRRLFAICERALCAALCVENAAETLTLADQHGAAALKGAALRFVAANAVAVMATAGWAHLLSSRPALIAEALHTLATGAPPEPSAAPPAEEQDAGAASAEGENGVARRVRQRTR